MRIQQQDKAGKKCCLIYSEEEEGQNSRTNLKGIETNHHDTQILLFQAHVPPETEQFKRLLEPTQSPFLAHQLYQQEDRGVKGPQHLLLHSQATTHGKW